MGSYLLYIYKLGCTISRFQANRMVWLQLCEDMLKMLICPLTAGGVYGTAVIKHYLGYSCKQSSCAYKDIQLKENAFENVLKTVCLHRPESGHENRCVSKENSVAAHQAHFSPSSKCVGVYLNVSMKGTDSLLSYLLIAEVSQQKNIVLDQSTSFPIGKIPGISDFQSGNVIYIKCKA